VVLAKIPGQVRLAKLLIEHDLIYRIAASLFFFGYGIYCLFKYRSYDFFWIVAIEISTYCNRQCYYCHLSNRGGAVEIEGETAKKRCMFPRNAIVDFEGNVLLCCNDYFHANRFGNVVDESILTIWKKKDFRALRKAAKKGKPELQLCEDCLYPGQQSSHDES